MQKKLDRYSRRDRALRKNLRRFAVPARFIATACRGSIGRGAKVIAVSGSYGKTTTTRAVASSLGLPERKSQQLGFNAFASLYLQLIAYTAFRKLAVVEVGIGMPGQMKHYARTIRPDISIITGVGEAHIGNYPDGIDGILREKGELVRALSSSGTAVLNADDERVMSMAALTPARVLTFGFSDDADIRILGIEPKDSLRSQLWFRYKGEEHRVLTRLLGRTAAYSLAPALALGIELRGKKETVAAIERLPPTPGRLETLLLEDSVVVVIDDFKGTPPTVIRAIDEIRSLPASRRIAVLGHIPESTPQPHGKTYYFLGRHAGQVLDQVFLIHLSDRDFEAYRDGLIDGGMSADQVHRLDGVEDAIVQLKAMRRPRDVILLKGHGFDRLSRIALGLSSVPVRCFVRRCPRIGPVRCATCELLASSPDETISGDIR